MTEVEGEASRPRSWRASLVIACLGVLAGLALAAWGLVRSEYARDWLFGSALSPAKSDIVYTPQPVKRSTTLPEADVNPQVPTDLAARLASVEARVAKVESAGVGEPGKAQALLVAFAARRAVEKGMALGYIEGELNRQFGQSQPRAVSMIIAAAHQPVTRDKLISDFDTIAPQLTGVPADKSWWDSFSSGMASLIIVRKAGEPSPDPVQRAARAREMVAGGRIDQALAEVARLPNRDKAARWIADARRLIEAQRALDLLEAAAILPRAPAPLPTPTESPAAAGPQPVPANSL